MKRYLIFLLISLVSSGYGKSAVPTTYYHYDNTRISLTNRDFKVYIKPQLRNMLSDYYGVLKTLNPIQKELIQIKKGILELVFTWNQLGPKCQNETEECLKYLQKLQKISIRLEKSLQKPSFKGIEIKKTYPQIETDSILSMLAQLDELAVANYKIIHFAEELIITFKTPFSTPVHFNRNLSMHLNKMKIISEMLVTSQLPKHVRKEFDFVFSNFFRSIEAHVLQNTSPTQLLNRLDDYNLAWNTFHMKITKGSIKLKKGRNMIRSMHLRWNSVLKFLLN